MASTTSSPSNFLCPSIHASHWDQSCCAGRVELARVLTGSLRRMPSMPGLVMVAFSLQSAAEYKPSLQSVPIAIIIAGMPLPPEFENELETWLTRALDERFARQQRAVLEGVINTREAAMAAFAKSWRRE
jgi:hypothetical protein